MTTAYEKARETNRRMQLLALIDQELDRAVARHSSMASPHEGWAVIKEELDELWDHVRADTGHTRPALKEAMQIAAMALRYIYDLGDGDLPIPEDEDEARDYLDRFRRVSQ